MHIENESAKIMTIGEHEFEEIVKEYEEEILMHEEVPKTLLTDTVDTTPVQGKLRCITLIFDNHHIYVCCAFILQEFYENHYIY
jgi:hypothetical protein